MMTRKDFVVVAKALKDSKPDIRQKDVTDEHVKVWENTVENMADALRNTNPNFNRYTFTTACGLGEDDL